jgi:glycosyltransferase involved in cell wall biosynthesis
MNELSIITINYNNALGLQKTFSSLFSQTIQNYEYIVIDGGSSDDSLKIIEQNENKISFWVSEKDNGVYHAMNKGIARATGAYLMFLNSGDFLIDSNSIKLCINFIQEVPNIDIFYGDMVVVNDPKSPEGRHHKHPCKITLNFFKNQTINHQASLIKAELFKEFGSYPESYKIASDYWLYLKSLLSGKSFKYLNFPMVCYDFNGISSIDNYRAYKDEKQLIWQNLVPGCVKDLISENEEYKDLTEYTIVKSAIQLNKKFQVFKSKF